MEFVFHDPRKSGVFVLRGRNKTLWVWQNRPFWTDRDPGGSFATVDLPRGTSKVEVCGWDGLRRTTTVPVRPGGTSATISGLPAGETLMFPGKGG